MIASDLLRAAIAASLLLVRDVREIGLVLASLGLVSSFFGPAQSAALRTLDSPQDLLAANAMLSQAFHAVRILSPAVAGALIRGFGHSFTWTENSRVDGSIPPLKPSQARTRATARSRGPPLCCARC